MPNFREELKSVSTLRHPSLSELRGGMNGTFYLRVFEWEDSIFRYQGNVQVGK